MSQAFLYKRGISLIEVVVGITLMGTLATSAIIAGSSHLRQLHAAQAKHRAVESIDQFLTQWSSYNFKLDRVFHAANEAGVQLQGSTGDVTSASQAATWTYTRPESALELEVGNEVPALKGRVYRIIARGNSGAVAATAEIVIGND